MGTNSDILIDDETDSFYMKENQAASSDSSSALLSGKILQFKKSLSMNHAPLQNRPIVE